MIYARPNSPPRTRRLGLVEHPGQDPLVGVELNGRYRIDSVIARGGMAIVYRAVDLRLGREIAVKVMNADLMTSERDFRRFVREAQSAASLNHPGIVQVFDQGQHENINYLAMEYVPGITLRARLQSRGALPASVALEILDQILAALAIAHDQGLAHRDMKPENVLLTHEEIIKVVDFGLARFVGQAQQTQATGLMFGTVAYLAPEQAERGHADERSDIYAVGIMLFEMLCGHPPFQGDTPVSIALQHVTTPVPLLSVSQPGLLPEFDELVQWATAKNPQERPGSAAIFRNRVQRVCARYSAEQLDQINPGQARPERAPAQATTALPPVTAQPTRTFTPIAAVSGPASHSRPTADAPRRGRWLVTVIVLVAALLIGAGWYLGAGPGRRIAVPDLVKLEKAQAVQELTKRELDNRISQSYSNSIPAGKVISTSPLAGRRLSPDSVVTVVISRGPERTKVPDIIGETEADARQILSQARINPGQITRIYSDTAPVGEILGSNPDTGAGIDVGSEVALEVSKGPAPVELASWVGKPAPEALAELRAAQLRPAVTEAFSDTVAVGVVISQDPGAGTVARGSAVALVVSKGSEFVRVPAVIGRSVDKAKEILRASGLEAQENAIFSGRVKAVVAQDPLPGSRVRRGTSVRIAVP